MSRLRHWGQVPVKYAPHLARWSYSSVVSGSPDIEVLFKATIEALEEM
jgi:hypothetical protein